MIGGLNQNHEWLLKRCYCSERRKTVTIQLSCDKCRCFSFFCFSGKKNGWENNWQYLLSSYTVKIVSQPDASGAILRGIKCPGSKERTCRNKRLQVFQGNTISEEHYLKQCFIKKKVLRQGSEDKTNKQTNKTTQKGNSKHKQTNNNNNKNISQSFICMNFIRTTDIPRPDIKEKGGLYFSPFLIPVQDIMCPYLANTNLC